MVRKLVARHGSVLAFYGAGVALYLALRGLPPLPLFLAGAFVLALKGAALAGGRPFMAAAPGAFAFLGAALFQEAPLLAALAAAMAVGVAVETASLLANTPARSGTPGTERAPRA